MPGTKPFCNVKIQCSHFLSAIRRKRYKFTKAAYVILEQDACPQKAQGEPHPCLHFEIRSIVQLEIVPSSEFSPFLL